MTSSLGIYFDNKILQSCTFCKNDTFLSFFIFAPDNGNIFDLFYTIGHESLQRHKCIMKMFPLYKG